MPKPKQNTTFFYNVKYNSEVIIESLNSWCIFISANLTVEPGACDTDTTGVDGASKFAASGRWPGCRIWQVGRGSVLSVYHPVSDVLSSLEKSFEKQCMPSRSIMIWIRRIARPYQMTLIPWPLTYLEQSWLTFLLFLKEKKTKKKQLYIVLSAN